MVSLAIVTINVGEVSKHFAPPRTHFERALEIRDSLKFHIDLDGVGKDATLIRLIEFVLDYVRAQAYGPGTRKGQIGDQVLGHQDFLRVLSAP